MSKEWKRIFNRFDLLVLAIDKGELDLDTINATRLSYAISAFEEELLRALNIDETNKSARS